MQSKYVVASKKNRTIRSFELASQVASFMLGRRLSEWSIYQRQDDLPADALACEKVLVARETLSHAFIPAETASEGLKSAIGPRDSL